MFWLIDRITVWSTGASKEKVEFEFDKVSKDFKENESDKDLIFTLLDAIDSKTAALLSHISLLIAVVSVIHATAECSSAIRKVLAIEVVCYLFVTIACLRCIRMTSSSFRHTCGGETGLKFEFFIRREVYKLAVRATIVLTLVFIVSFLYAAFVV